MSVALICIQSRSAGLSSKRILLKRILISDFCIDLVAFIGSALIGLNNTAQLV